MEKSFGWFDPDIAHILVIFVIVLEVPRLKGLDQYAPDRSVIGIKRMTEMLCPSAEGVHFVTAQGYIRISGDLRGFL